MQSKFKLLILITSALGAIGVILGAFGSHWLAERLSEKSLSAYKTGVMYHFIHTLALFWNGLTRILGGCFLYNFENKDKLVSF